MWSLKYQDSVLKTGTYDECFIALGAAIRSKGYKTRLQALASKKFTLTNDDTVMSELKKNNADALFNQLQEAVNLSLKNDLTWVPNAMKLLHSITNI